MLSRIKFEIEPLVNEMLDQLPSGVWASTETTFLDPAIAGGQFVRVLEQRLRAAGHSDDNISGRVFGYEKYDHQVNYAINKYKLIGKYAVCDFLEKDFKDMKFDVIVGNPPFQDGKKGGGQNKIYNQFCKKSLTLLRPTGIIGFITPASVLKDSKRFSLVGQSGLKYINFTTNRYFDVGVKIISWVIDKSYVGEVSVKCKDQTYTISSSQIIYDTSEINLDIAKIKESIRVKTTDPNNRMFLRNNIGPARSKRKTKEYCYPLNKFDGKISYYIKKLPFFHQKIS